MTTIEAAQYVLDNGVSLMRQRKDAPDQFDVKEAFTGNKRGWFYMDAFTASAIVNVYKALNETNRAKYAALPLPKLITVTWKLVK
jgi:hypothetical protein